MKAERISTFCTHGKKYELVVIESRYCAIAHEFIDDNGCVTKRLNGIQMMASRTLDELIRRVEERARFEELIDEGIEKNVAMLMASGVPKDVSERLAKKMESLA